MKRSTEQYGKTIEEAIRKGLEELKLAREDVTIEVLEEPKSGGILGVLSQKLAKVRVIEDKKISQDVLDATEEKIKEMLTKIFDIARDSVEITCKSEGKQVVVTLKSDNPKHLIGYKGRTIEAIQSLLNAMLRHEDDEYSKVFIEINDYKKQKEEKLKSYANKMASNVVKYGKPIKLEPMSAYERLIIHQELANNKSIITQSYGEEPRRRLVIKKSYMKR